jgi:hypothetical protein
MLLTAYGLFFRTGFEKGFLLSAGVHRNQRFCKSGMRQPLDMACKCKGSEPSSPGEFQRLSLPQTGFGVFDVLSARHCHLFAFFVIVDPW